MSNALTPRPEHIAFVAKYLDEYNGVGEADVACRLVAEWLRDVAKDMIVEHLAKISGLSKNEATNTEAFRSIMENLDL